MMNNLKQLLNTMKPEQIALNAISKNNPMMRNMISMAQKGDVQSLQTFARNVCKERGVDFDTEFSNFMSNFR